MFLETDFTYELETEFEGFNENLLLKPSAYQKLCAKLGDIHLSKIDMHVDKTIENNLAWILTTLSIEIIKPVTVNIVSGKTWYSGRKGPLFRREYLFSDEKGDVLFKGFSFSVLLDMDNRLIYRKRELPFKMTEPIEDFTIEAKNNRKLDLDFIKLDERKVYNSFIDPLGHVNNCRYSEFAYDALSENEINDLYGLRRMDIYFRSELRKDDIFSLYKTKDESTIYIRGMNKSKGDISFDIRFAF